MSFLSPRVIYNSILRQRTVVKQTAVLFGAHIIALLLALIAQSIRTHGLGDEKFGEYSFFLMITGFTVNFFQFGIFSSIKVLLAESNDPIHDRELYGVGFIFATLIGILYMLCLLIISFFIDHIFKVNFGATLRMISPLCIILPFQFLIPALAIGSNTVINDALFKVSLQSFMILPILILLIFNKINVNMLIVTYIFAYILAVMLSYIRFAPLFSNMRQTFALVLKKNKTYGVHLYAGQIIDKATYDLDKVFISAFVNNVQLGFYTLAISVLSPIPVLSASLSNALFKQLAQKNQVSHKIVLYNSVYLVFATFGVIFAGQYFVNIIFGVDFAEVYMLMLILVFANLCMGLYQPYMSFLAGKSIKELKYAAFFSAAVNLTANIILIPRYGTVGASIATVFSMATWLILLYVYYNRYIRGGFGNDSANTTTL